MGVLLRELLPASFDLLLWEGSIVAAGAVDDSNEALVILVCGTDGV